MRMLLTILACIAFLTPRAQIQQSHLQIRPFTSVNMGYMFLGGGLTYVSAPVGIAVYRPLNNNFTAFASASVAPTAFHFSSLYNTPYYNHGYPSNGFTGFGVNAAVSGGLIYTNDAHTFSISGGITVERDSYPLYIPPARTRATKQY